VAKTGVDIKPLYSRSPQHAEITSQAEKYDTIELCRLPQNPAILSWFMLSDTVALSAYILCHGDDDISLFVSFFDIPVGLGDLFQWIASVYDRFDLARLNQLFEEN
jgi:hypothetical protein